MRGKRPASDKASDKDNGEEEVGGETAGYEENEPVEP